MILYDYRTFAHSQAFSQYCGIARNMMERICDQDSIKGGIAEGESPSTIFYGRHTTPDTYQHIQADHVQIVADRQQIAWEIAVSKPNIKQFPGGDEWTYSSRNRVDSSLVDQAIMKVPDERRKFRTLEHMVSIT
jgi:hypothetical protein